MSLDLYQNETADRMLSLRPVMVPEPDAFDGFLRGTGMHAMRTFAKAGSAIDLLGSVGPIIKDAFTGGTEAQDRYFKEHDEVFGNAIDHWTPKPGEVGAAGEVAGTLLGTLPLVLASPSLTVGTTQLSTAEELVRKGVDAEKAQAVGGVQALGLGLGIYMPIFGQSLWQRMLLGGAGFNVIQGAAMRGASDVVLQGTPAEGEFKAFDAKALTLDLLLGLAFGAITHLSPTQRVEGARYWERMKEWGNNFKPSDVDAIATLRQAQHANVDTLPGKPIEASDLQSHVERIRTATEQLLRGEPVDVSTIPAGKFNPVPKRFVEAAKRADMLVSEAAAVAKAYDIVLERPVGPIDDPLVRMTSEAIGEVVLERGPAFQKQGQAEIQVGGYGLVKIIWKHGEKSRKAQSVQVTREDVLRTSEVVRDFMPVEDSVQADGKRLLEWQVTREDGKKVIYSVRRFADDDRQHVVSIFVNEGQEAKFTNKPISEKRNRLPESPGVASKASQPEISNRGSFSSDHPDSQVSGSRKTIAPESEVGKVGADQPKSDPLTLEAQRFVDENPDVKMSVGRDANGEPVTKTAREYLDETRAETSRLRKDASLFEIAAACLMGVM